MVDTTKFPSDLKVHRVWVSRSDSDGRHAIVFVSERRRRMIGGLVIGLGLLAFLGVLLLHGEVFLIIIGVVISGAGAYYANGGRSGFYEVDEDGTLGKYLGRAKPDLDAMRGMRVH